MTSLAYETVNVFLSPIPAMSFSPNNGAQLRSSSVDGCVQFVPVVLRRFEDACIRPIVKLSTADLYCLGPCMCQRAGAAGLRSRPWRAASCAQKAVAGTLTIPDGRQFT